jgi:FAD:protein FMN transferase
MRPAGLVLALAALLCCSPSSQAQEAWVSANRTFALNGLPIKVTVWAKDRAGAGQALDVAAKEAERLHQQYSPLRLGSVISRLNQTTGEKPVTVDAETLRLLQWALKLAKETQGSLDLTTTAYKWQYGFGQDDYHVPTDLRLDQVSTLVSHTYVDLYPRERTVLFKRQGVQIDLDEILKNYALTRLRQAARDQGKALAGRIDLGPSVAVWGHPPGARAWPVAIYDPRQRSRVLAVVPLTRGRLLSAGAYESVFVREGQGFHPYLDPRTGKPVRHSLGGTLLLPDEPKLDLPAAALMLMKPEQAVALVESIPGAECLIVDAAGKTWLSRGWAKTLALADK